MGWKETYADRIISPDEGVVTKNGDELHLTKTEFKLLVELASQPGKVFSREVLLERVWGYDYFGETRTVDVHIRQLRKKLDGIPIETVWGVGYRIETG